MFYNIKNFQVSRNHRWQWKDRVEKPLQNQHNPSMKNPSNWILFKFVINNKGLITSTFAALHRGTNVKSIIDPQSSSCEALLSIK